MFMTIQIKMKRKLSHLYWLSLTPPCQVLITGIGKSDGRYPSGGGGGLRRVNPLCPSDYELMTMAVATDMLMWLEQQYPPVVMVIDIKELWNKRPYDIPQVNAWLWALHNRGEVSVTLYSEHPSRENPIFNWVQDFNAYLLIAETGERMAYFLQYDVGFFFKHQEILLNPLAHLVIVLTEITSSHQRYLNSSRMSLKAAWMCHRSLYAVVLTVNEDGNWMRVFADPLHRPSDLAYTDIHPVYPYDTEWSVFKTYPLETDLEPDVISKVVGKRRKDLNLARIPALFEPVNQRNYMREDNIKNQGLRHHELGDDTRSLFVLSEYLNFQIGKAPTYPDILDDINDNDKIDTILEKTGVYIIMNRFNAEAFNIRKGRLLERSFEIVKAVFIVPRAQPLPLWSLPMRVFGKDIWIGLFVAMVVYAVMWRVVAGESPLACVAAALRAFSPCRVPPQDRISPSSQRLQLAGALLASAVVVAAAYQGRLFILMADPDYGEEMNSLEDIGKSNIPLLIRQNANDDELDEDPIGVKLRIHKVRMEKMNVPDWGGIIKYAAKKDYQVAFGINWCDIFPIELRYPREYKRLRPMKNDQTTLFFGLVTSRTNPWHSEINKFLLLCEETGLRIRWKRDARVVYLRLLRSQNYINSPDDKNDDKEKIKPFILSDLFLQFQVLIAGLLASAITLGYELYENY